MLTFMALAGAAIADDKQTARAAAIHHLSISSNADERAKHAESGKLYPLLNHERALHLSGCLARIVFQDFDTQNRKNQEYRVTFDLTHTSFPAPDAKNGPDFAYFPPNPGKSDGMAGFTFRFLPPHEAVFEVEPEAALLKRSRDWQFYTLDDQPDDSRIRALLAALKSYQADYCTVTG